MVHPGIKTMSKINMVHTILCPTTTVKAKLANKFIRLMFQARKQLDEGIPVLNMGYEKGVEVNPFFENDSDSEDSFYDVI